MFTALLALLVAQTALAAPSAADPCAVIGGQKWVSTQQLRACLQAVPNDPKIKANILEVVGKTFALHTSTNYQIRAPEPFTQDVHEDILKDIARISSTNYPDPFAMHVDLVQSVKRLNDGHAAYINFCFDSLYISYLPIPLVLLDDRLGLQGVFIAPEAATVASAEFPDQIDFWNNATGTDLSKLSGAKVLLIDDRDPWDAINKNAEITGSFQSHATRQNAFFSSYNRAASGWSYIMGNFAQQSLPLFDSRKLTVLPKGSLKPLTITVPYRSRINPATVPFTSTDTLVTNNCVAVEGTNGVDAYAVNEVPSPEPNTRFQPATQKQTAPKKQLVSVELRDTPFSDVVLPPGLTPPNPTSGSSGVAQFYILDDKKTGVLALGSFSADSFDGLQQSLLDGLTNLKSQGASQLIVDITGNGGGFICVAHFLHRIIAGPSNLTEPQAGLDTEARAGPLAQQIVAKINAGADPQNFLLYNPSNWRFENETQIPVTFNWLDPGVPKTINGKQDRFSVRLGDECQPFDIAPPAAALFDPKKVAIVGSGRCASSCSLFSITMVKEQGAKPIVMGGSAKEQQQYCGTVGGQSTDFATMDTEIKTTKLKDSPLAPPDFLTNSVQGITWRLGFGIDNTNEPEEWQNHAAKRIGLTAATVNNPSAIWKDVASKVF